MTGTLDSLDPNSFYSHLPRKCDSVTRKYDSVGDSGKCDSMTVLLGSMTLYKSYWDIWLCESDIWLEVWPCDSWPVRTAIYTLCDSPTGKNDWQPCWHVASLSPAPQPSLLPGPSLTISHSPFTVPVIWAVTQHVKTGATTRDNKQSQGGNVVTRVLCWLLTVVTLAHWIRWGRGRLNQHSRVRAK